MTERECADILRSFIRHRVRMNKNLYAVDADGKENKISKPNDILLDAVKFALAFIEERIPQK